MFLYLIKTNMVIPGTTTPVYNNTGSFFLKNSTVLHNFTMLISSSLSVVPSTAKWICVKGDANINSNTVAKGLFSGVNLRF